MIDRRNFLGALAATAAGLVLPEPPRVRAYSFLPGERLRIRADEIPNSLICAYGDTQFWLLIDQVPPMLNGVWVVERGDWTRASYFGSALCVS